MVIRPKAVRWGITWSAVEDSKLLVGLYEYGMGNWTDVKQDKSLGLHNKVKSLYQSDRVKTLLCVIDSSPGPNSQTASKRFAD